MPFLLAAFIYVEDYVCVKDLHCLYTECYTFHCASCTTYAVITQALLKIYIACIQNATLFTVRHAQRMPLLHKHC